MDDLISRQAAIDLFPNDDLEWDTNCGYIAPHLVRRMIEELPSAQPEQVIKDCRNCKHGKYNDYHDTYFCYNTEDCSNWNKWAVRKEEIRPYDPIWDMYLDEFEDEDEERKEE